MNTKQWVSLVVVAIVFAGGGFFGGMKYQQSKAPAATARTGGAAGAFARRGGGAGGANMSFVSGQVLSVDSNTITVQLQSGGSQHVVLAPSTQYGKMVSGSSTDVTVGTSIIATGSTNQDGSVTAQNVQIRTGTSTPIGFPRGGAGTPPGQ